MTDTLDTPGGTRPREYTVLARRFRPQTLGEVIGQDAVAVALRNAIAGGRVAHAYLFAGARGVGKTSTARILAKALNCPHRRGPDPCNQCEICQSIAAGSDVDVLEIDGASNRGIDDVRQLRAGVSVRPMRSANKIYIIDEVHMLTRDAFNALLKTLEEPPPNVKFIFCTTEPNKLPDTILSRCQRFDFSTISQDSIAERLAAIAQLEGKAVEPAAIELVARRAAGSMRDSQSLFDQLLAFGGETITAADVHRLLGTAPDERLLDVVSAAAAGRAADVLQQVHDALAEGVQLGEFCDQLIAFLRDLMLLAAGADNVPLASVSERLRPELADRARNWGLRSILAALQILAETKARMQRAHHDRALLELALVRLALLDDLQSLADLSQWLRAASAAQTAPGPMPMPAVRRSIPESREAAPVASPASARPIPSSAEPPAAEATPAREAIAWEPENASRLWQAVLSQLNDLLGDACKKAASAAISGPNQLVLTFPVAYDQSRKFVEQHLSRLEQVASGLAGRAVRVMARRDEAAPEAAAPAPAAPAVDPERKAAQQDPFVQRVLELFGGRIEKTQPL